MSTSTPLIVAIVSAIFFFIAVMAYRASKRNEAKYAQTKPNETDKKDGEKTEVPSGGEDIPKGGFRAKRRSWWKPILIVLGILVLLVGIGTAVYYLWLSGPSEPTAPKETRVNEVETTYEKRVQVSVADEWIPLVSVMPKWYMEDGNWERKFLDTDHYILEVKITQNGEPYLYCPDLGIGPKSHSIDQQKAMWVRI